jgi:hypothetical protein
MQPLEFIFKETTRGVASQKPVLLADNFLLFQLFLGQKGGPAVFLSRKAPHIDMIRYYGDMLKMMHPKNE